MAFSPDGQQFWSVLGLHRFREIIPNLRQYQSVQTTRDAITVNLVCQPTPSTQQLQMLQAVLEQALGHTYRWTWQIRETELPLTASGKFEEFVSLVTETDQCTWQARITSEFLTVWNMRCEAWTTAQSSDAST